MAINNSCFHDIKDNNYCSKCGSIVYKNLITIKHYKYSYKPELSPLKIFEKMKKTNKITNFNEVFPEKNSVSKFYFSHRHILKSFIKKMNSQLENNSRSFFLSLYYMDLIFTNENLENVFYSHFSPFDYEYGYNSQKELPKRFYYLLSLSCLITASKFNENDPHVPNLSDFISICEEDTKGNYVFDLNALGAGEVITLKILNYKLQYYSLYHYVLFFFTHGLLFKSTIEKTNIFKKIGERKILEKIYIQSREILDLIIDKKEYYNLYIGEENYITAAIILIWSIESVLSIKLNDDENIFKLIYNIEIDKQKYEQIYIIITEIISKNQLKNENYFNSLFKKNLTPLNPGITIKKMNQNQIPTQDSNNNSLNPNLINRNTANFSTSSTSIMTNITNSKTYSLAQPYNLQYQKKMNNRPMVPNSSKSFIILTNDQNNNKENENHIIYAKNNRIYLNSKIGRASCRARVVANSNEKINDNKSPYKLPCDSSKGLKVDNILFDKNMIEKLNSSNNIDFNSFRNNKIQTNNKKDENNNKIGKIDGITFKNSKRYYISRVRRRANSSQKNVTTVNDVLLNKYILRLSTDAAQKDEKDSYSVEKKINSTSNINLYLNTESNNNLRASRSPKFILETKKNKNNNNNNQNINPNRDFFTNFSPIDHNLENNKILFRKFYNSDEAQENNKLNKTLGETNYKNIINKTKKFFIDKIPEDNKKRFSTKSLCVGNLKNKYSETDKNETIIINNNIHINNFIDKPKISSDKNVKILYDNDVGNKKGKNLISRSVNAF